jgi:DNA-binding response OmpR family regulator
VGPAPIRTGGVPQAAGSVAVARVLALTADLMFGSRIQGALAAAGHEVALVADETQLRAALSQGGVDALVIDLTDERLDAPAVLLSLAAELEGTRTLAFYSHVETAARERGLAAGIELVVPRSRMAREGTALIDGLLASREG